MEPSKLSLLAYNKVKETEEANEEPKIPEVVDEEIKNIADKQLKKGLLKAWRKNKKPQSEQITIRDGKLMTSTAMRRQLRKYYEGVNDDHHFYYPGVLTFVINLKNTREKNYTNGFPVPLIQDHEEVDEFFRGLHIDYERLINDTINEMTKEELINFYNNVFFHDEMLRSEIPKEDDRHITNPRYFKQEEPPEPEGRAPRIFVVDGVLAAKSQTKKKKLKTKKLKTKKPKTKKPKTKKPKTKKQKQRNRKQKRTIKNPYI